MPKEQVVADEKILHKPEEEIVEVLGEVSQPTDFYLVIIFSP